MRWEHNVRQLSPLLVFGLAVFAQSVWAPALSQTVCPTVADLSAGAKTSWADGTVIRFEPSGQYMLMTTTRPNGQTLLSRYFAHRPERSECPAGTSGVAYVVTWETPFKSLRDLGVGETIEEHATQTNCQGAISKLTHRFKGIADAMVTINSCRYPVRLFEKTTLTDGKMSNVVSINYSFDLGWTLKSTLTMPDGKTVDYAITAIEKLP
jgi:hypothetical protein